MFARKNLMRLVGVFALIVVLGIGATAYSVLKTPEAATSPISAIPVEAAGTSEDTSSTGTTSSATEATDGQIIFTIDQSASEASFTIDEVLNNAPKTVVGTTDQVAGEIAIDPNDPSQSRVGTIQINARTLATDSDMRNRAVKNRILSTDTYEFITFTPTAISGLPTTGTTGQSHSFEVTGDLTIRDVTKAVTFDVTLTPASETRLEGTATATILYADYGLAIPEVPQVASVDDQVTLELNFVAVAQ